MTETAPAQTETDERRPVITSAHVKAAGPRDRRIWDLYADRELIGWTPQDPAAAVPPFGLSCWAYGTGRHVTVRLSDSLTVS